ncbi:hypothetical protein Pst134EA_030369 [Puccinia striiformis f. sp. tritici]|uniref:hypothetical protein n=1 Tax=Puccinia striiformis f. sp. tritici TaxID=168172 RepID=UPI0020087EDE|nr:hypothetical protein Pst134EA_030369 [Puccinia striiformis f. sp. tritici]KAH9446450.1 hypothetical protein Pst134EA_030369 [Puccinia striiformis f. sp. tritici]KAI9599950.1 hypothetical protein KEM48_000061 [Puccinia striiformis f. sp. tritici PST-130]
MSARLDFISPLGMYPKSGMMSSQQRAHTTTSAVTSESASSKQTTISTPIQLILVFSLRSAERQLPGLRLRKPSAKSGVSFPTFPRTSFSRLATGTPLIFPEFEKHRNVSVKYDRELVQTTITAIDRVAAINAKREKAFYSARMTAAAPVVRKSMAAEVVKERHVLQLKDDKVVEAAESRLSVITA